MDPESRDPWHEMAGGHTAAGSGAVRGARLSLSCLLLAVAMIAALTASIQAEGAGSGPDVLTCTNQASGADWTITIDFARKTVDSWPASITARWISWHDRNDQGYYSLDRASGELTTTRASSTGGYQLKARCRHTK